MGDDLLAALVRTEGGGVHSSFRLHRPRLVEDADLGAGGIDREGLGLAGGDAAGDEEEVGGGVDLRSDVDAQTEREGRRPRAGRGREEGGGRNAGREGREAGGKEEEGALWSKTGPQTSKLWSGRRRRGLRVAEDLQRRSKGTLDAEGSSAEKGRGLDGHPGDWVSLQTSPVLFL